MNPDAPIIPFDATGLPTWTLADGTTFTRDALSVVTISRPGREPIQGRMGATETPLRRRPPFSPAKERVTPTFHGLSGFLSLTG